MSYSNTDRAYHAICEIVAEVEKDLKIKHPGILVSDIATQAKMSESKTFRALCNLEIGVPTKGSIIGRRPCVHRSGDRWYLETGKMDK